MRKKTTGIKLKPDHRYAVLTGDVIGSSKLNDATRRELPAVLRKVSQAAQSLYGANIPLTVDVFRGDSWQMIVTDATLGLRVAIFFWSYLRSHFPNTGLDTRIAIGIGTIKFVPNGQIRQGDGPAFRESGWGLEAMAKRRRLTLAIANTTSPAEVAPVIELIDTLMGRWTEKQSLAVVGMLQGLPQSKIAGLWNPPIKQPVIARHLRQAGWGAVEGGLVCVENILNKLSIYK